MRAPTPSLTPPAGAAATTVTTGPEATGERVHLYVDQSNMLLRAEQVGVAVQRVLRGRACDSQYVAGALRQGAAVWREYRRLGFTLLLQTYEGKEDLVDDALHAQILNGLLRQLWRTADSAATQVLVVLTGDGNANHSRCSFPECCEHALRLGWRVEVWSNGNCGKGFLALAGGSNGRMDVGRLHACLV